MGLSALHKKPSGYKVPLAFALGVLVPGLSHAGEGLVGVGHQAPQNCLAALIRNGGMPTAAYQYYRDLHIALLTRLVSDSQKMIQDQRALAANLILRRELVTQSHIKYPGEDEFSLRVWEFVKRTVERSPEGFRKFEGRDDSFLIAEIVELREIYKEYSMDWGEFAIAHARTREEIVEALEIANQADELSSDLIWSQSKGFADNARPSAPDARVREVERALIAQAEAPGQILKQIVSTSAQQEEHQLIQAILPILQVGFFKPGIIAQALSQALMDLGADTDRKVNIALQNILHLKKIPGIEIKDLAVQVLKRLNQLMQEDQNLKLMPDWDKYKSDPRLLASVTQWIYNPSPQLIRKTVNMAAASQRRVLSNIGKLTLVVGEDGRIYGKPTVEELPKLYERVQQLSPFERERFMQWSLGRLYYNTVDLLLGTELFKQLDSEFKEKFKRALQEWQPTVALFEIGVGNSVWFAGSRCTIEEFLDRVIAHQEVASNQKFSEYLKAEYEAAIKDPVRGPKVLKKLHTLMSKVENARLGANGIYYTTDKYSTHEEISQAALWVFQTLTPQDPRVVSCILAITSFYDYNLPLAKSARELLRERYFEDPRVKAYFSQGVIYYLDKRIFECNLFIDWFIPFLTHPGGAKIFNQLSNPIFDSRRLSEILEAIRRHLIAAKTLSPEAKKWVLSLPPSLRVSFIEVFEKSEAFELSEKTEGILREMEYYLDIPYGDFRETVLQLGINALLRLNAVSGALAKDSPHRERLLKILSERNGK